MMNKFWAVLALAALAALTAVVVAVRSHPRHHQSPAPPAPTAAAIPAAPARSHYVGVSAVPVKGLPAFQRSTGIRPGLVEIYTTFRSPPAPARLAAVLHRDALPMIQMSPYGTPLAAIAAGRWDGYLRRYGAALASLHARLAMSFAPEANGSWYEWGCHRTGPATYITAWRRVHDIITSAGANVIWVWDVNKLFPHSCPIRQRWPGPAYVNWVGIDAYWRHPGDTYANAIAPTIAAVRAFTGKHVLIAETGAPPGPEAVSWVHGLFTRALRVPGVIGVVWFDYHSGHGDFRLEDDPPVLAAFRAGIASIRHASPGQGH